MEPLLPLSIQDHPQLAASNMTDTLIPKKSEPLISMTFSGQVCHTYLFNLEIGHENITNALVNVFDIKPTPLV